MAETGRLSAKQLKLLAALLSTANTREAAEQAGVSERTAFRWLTDPVFQASLVAAKQEAFTEALERLKSGVGRAIDTLAASMESAESESVRLRAAAIWLEAAIAQHKMSEIEERFAELEQLVKASGLVR